MKKNIMFLLLMFLGLRSYAISPNHLREGYYGNTDLAPYPGNSQVGSDPAYDNDRWYYAPPKYCGFKLTWTDASKKTLLLESGMNPLNGADCQHNVTAFTCQEQTCASTDYQNTLVPSESGFSMITNANSVRWIFSSTKDPQDYLFPASKKLFLAGSKVATVDQLCEVAKSETTQESIQKCKSAGNSKCDILYSGIRKSDNFLNLFCEYEVVTKGKL